MRDRKTTETKLGIAIKKHDQWIKQIYRFIGHYVASGLKNTPVKANHLTISRVIWITSAALLIHFESHLYYILASICIFLFSMLDAADGSLAQMKNQRSMLGTWLDPQIDRVGFLILFSSIAIHLGKDPIHGKFWIFFTMYSLLMFYFRSLIPLDIRLKEKYKSLRPEIANHVKKSKQDKSKPKTLISFLNMQMAPHTHNIALYVMIALILDKLKWGILFIGIYISLWWVRENIGVIQKSVLIDKQNLS
jgi:phosphatidylglycerophosphate synthase